MQADPERCFGGTAIQRAHNGTAPITFPQSRIFGNFVAMSRGSFPRDRLIRGLVWIHGRFVLPIAWSKFGVLPIDRFQQFEGDDVEEITYVFAVLLDLSSVTSTSCNQHGPSDAIEGLSQSSAYLLRLVFVVYDDHCSIMTHDRAVSTQKSGYRQLREGTSITRIPDFRVSQCVS